jgi:osmotically-inducible protein OsmY
MHTSSEAIGGDNMDKNEEIRLDVLRELKSDRRISNPGRIIVAVKDGIVTLSGYVDHYMDQLAALEATERNAGVKGIVQEIEVELPSSSRRDDQEIARSACAAIEQNSVIPNEHVQVSVCDGKVTLEGELPEEHQKIEAGTTVSKVLGVTGVTNNIVIKPSVRPYDVTLEIERTFQHMAAHHAQDIQVEVKGDKVILRGVVRAWIEKAKAEEAASEVIGVKEVENRLEVTPLLEGKEKPPVKV